MKVIISGAVAGLATAALVSLAPAAQAATTQTVMIRPGEFVSALSDTRSAGHVDFLKEGLHVWTTDTTSNAKAAEYVAVPSQGIPSSVSLNWFGTQPQPGSQIVFDTDATTGNGNDYNVLVGEQIYGNDFWYTGGQARAALRGFTCPETTGGSGSDCHGTLAEWQAAVPAATVYAAGFSLGSGIQGDGVLHDIYFGDTDYQFTNEPEPAVITNVDVTGTATVTRDDRARRTIVKAVFVTDELGANQAQGQKLTFDVVSDGVTVFHDRMGAGEDSATKLTFLKHTHRHVVQVLKNGVIIRTLVIKMGK